MSKHRVQDPDYAARVARSFARQGIMETLGASLLRVAPGEVEIALPAAPEPPPGEPYVSIHARTGSGDIRISRA